MWALTVQGALRTYAHAEKSISRQNSIGSESWKCKVHRRVRILEDLSRVSVHPLREMFEFVARSMASFREGNKVLESGVNMKFGNGL